MLNGWNVTRCKTCNKKPENKKMEPKYKKGELVEFRHLDKKLVGKVSIIDWMPNEGFRYDVMINDPEMILFKHIYEGKLKKVKMKNGR